MMGLAYREMAPSPPLAPFVKCFWSLSGLRQGPAIQERILPDGAFELVFHCGEPFVSDGALQPRAMLVGQIRRPTLVTPSLRVDVIGVRFRPGGAAPFFREPMSELRDQLLPAGEVLRGWQRVMEETAVPDRFAVLEELLSRRMRVPNRWGAARAAISLISRRRGNLPMRQLTDATGLTDRTIQRAFLDCVGIPAKTFARLVRLQAWLADPFQDHGYFDDPHLIHEFRAFAGITPGEFRRERHAINDAFSRREGT